MKPNKTQNPSVKTLKDSVAIVQKSNPSDLLKSLESIQEQLEIRAVVVDFSGPLDSSDERQDLNSLIELYSVPLLLAASGNLIGWSAAVLLRSNICYSDESLQIHFRNVEEVRDYLGRDVRNQRFSEIVGADDALKLGLINSITIEGKAIDEALAAADCISHMAPLAVKACLDAVAAGKRKEDKGLDEELRLFSELFDSNDTKRGTNAFLNKTSPIFEGN